MSKTKDRTLDLAGSSCGQEYRSFRNPELERLERAKPLTFASYSLTPLQMNMLIHIQEGLYAALVSSLETRPMSRIISVPLYLKDYPRYKRNLGRFYEAVSSLMERRGIIRFNWRYMKDFPDILKYFMMLDEEIKAGSCMYEGQLVSCATALITGVHCIEGRYDALLVDLNPAALPFLVHYSFAGDISAYDKEVALGFSSAYSKRVYRLLSDWGASRSAKEYGTEDFSRYLQVPVSYTNRELRTRVLDPAKREINDSNSTFSFDYSMVYDPQYGIDTKRRKTANKIVFRISRKHLSKGMQREDVMVSLMYFLESIVDNEKECLCPPVAQRLVNSGQDLEFCRQFSIYWKRLQNGKITESHCKTTLLKIVRDMTGVDLRSQAHILHYELNRRKRSPVKISEPKLIANINS